MTPEGVGKPATCSGVARQNALTDVEVGRVLDAVRRLVAEHGGQSALERATGIRQQMVSRYTATQPYGRPGYAFARDVAKAMGMSAEELLGRTPAGTPSLASLPGWAEAAAKVLSESPELAEHVHRVGGILVPDEITITSEFVATMAYSYSRGKPRSKGPPSRKK